MKIGTCVVFNVYLDFYAQENCLEQWYYFLILFALFLIHILQYFTTYRFFTQLIITYYIFNIRTISDEKITRGILQRFCAETFITYGDTLAVTLSPAFIYSLDIIRPL